MNRRAVQGLGIDHHDRPVNPNYLQGIKDLGIEIRHVSRWLNGAVLTGMDAVCRWVEAINVATHVAIESQEADIIERLVDQKYSLNNLIIMLKEGGAPGPPSVLSMR